MAKQKVLTQGTSPGINPELELDFAEYSWTPCERILSKNRTVPENHCVIVYGSLDLSTFSLDIGLNAEMVIL